jgi:hypothetical protein
MITWKQVEALPGYEKATPQQKAALREIFDRYVASKVNKHDVLGGGVVNPAVKEAVAEQVPVEDTVRKARAQMASMRERGVKVPEEEALKTPVYDPVDLVVDAATGFMGSAGKAALKAGTKALAKNVAREVGTGAMAGAGMALADKAGAGAVGQLAAGLGTASVGSAALTGSRRLIASLIKKGMPESQAARIVREMSPDAVEQAVKAIEPTPGKIGKQTPIKRIGIAQAADASRLADDVTVHPEAEDYADIMAGYTPTQGKQAIPPADAQVVRGHVVADRYRYQQAPPEGPFGVEDTLKPVDKVEPVARPKPSEADPFVDQTAGFIPEEGVDVGRRVAIPEGVRHLPEGVTRGEDGKLYVTIAPAKRTVKAIPEAVQAVPEVATRPVTERPITFEQWADSKGIPKGTIASEFEEADLIGQTVFPQQHTAREAGKANAIAKKVANTKKLKAQYEAEVPEIVSDRPLDMGRGDDQAFVRTQEKRAIRKALANGETVDPELMAKYPDLAPKSGIGPSVPKAEKFSPGSKLGIVAPGTVSNPVKLDPYAEKYMQFSPPRKGIFQSLGEKAKALYAGLYDETAPIKDAVRKYAGEDARKQVDIAITQTLGTGAKANKRLNQLFDTVKSMLRNEQEYVDWETYRIAKRKVSLHGVGKAVDSEDAKEAADAIARLAEKYGPEGVARFEALSDTVRREFDGEILKMAREMGQISEETYKAIKEAPEGSAYATFLRIMDEEADAMGLPKVVMPGESVKKLKGGDQKLAPSLDGTIINLTRIYRMADQQKVNRLLVDLRDAHPGMQELIRPVGKVDGKRPPNSFFTYDNGHKVYWNVPSDIAEAMQFYGAKPMWEISKWFSPFTRLLRVGATMNPEFMFGKNPLRDMQTSAVIVGTPPVKGFLEGLSHVLKDRVGEDEVIRELIKDGGGNASMFALDREAVAGARARKLSWDTKGTKMLKHPVQFLRAMMELAEQSQRVGNYLHLKRQGKSGAEAAVEGARRGTLDFAHFGKHGRSLNGLVAFFNAALREQDQLAKKLFTEGKDSAKVWLRGSMYLTAPAIALWYMQKDNPRYQELPSWRKYGFWNIVTPKVIISLPRPFSLGMMFAGAPEAALNVAYKKDPNAITNWAKAFADSFFPDLIPTAAKPIVEVATNKNLFTGGTVVPRSVEGLPDEMQVTPTTSKTAEKVGKYLHYSPAKIDHLVRGYTAGLGKTAVGIADRWLGDERVRPSKSMAERIPVVKGLVAKEPVGYGSASVEAFYQLWEGMEKNYRGLKTLDEQGDRAALVKRARENQSLIRFYEDAKEIRKFLTGTRRDLQEIQATNELSPDQKKEVMDRIGKAMTTVTGNFLKAYYAKR